VSTSSFIKFHRSLRFFSSSEMPAGERAVLSVVELSMDGVYSGDSGPERLDVLLSRFELAPSFSSVRSRFEGRVLGAGDEGRPHEPLRNLFGVWFFGASGSGGTGGAYSGAGGAGDVGSSMLSALVSNVRPSPSERWSCAENERFRAGGSANGWARLSEVCRHVVWEGVGVFDVPERGDCSLFC
jgi:hypothetical protein